MYVLREVNYKLLGPSLLTKLCKVMHQEAASEIAGIEVYTETGDGKKDTNGCPVGKHSSKFIQERGGEKI